MPLNIRQVCEVSMKEKQFVNKLNQKNTFETGPGMKR